MADVLAIAVIIGLTLLLLAWLIGVATNTLGIFREAKGKDAKGEQRGTIDPDA